MKGANSKASYTPHVAPSKPLLLAASIRIGVYDIWTIQYLLASPRDPAFLHMLRKRRQSLKGKHCRIRMALSSLA